MHRSTLLLLLLAGCDHRTHGTDERAGLTAASCCVRPSAGLVSRTYTVPVSSRRFDAAGEIMMGPPGQPRDLGAIFSGGAGAGPNVTQYLSYLVERDVAGSYKTPEMPGCGGTFSSCVKSTGKITITAIQATPRPVPPNDCIESCVGTCQAQCSVGDANCPSQCEESCFGSCADFTLGVDVSCGSPSCSSGSGA